jgi:protein-L-isoaspartate(D-aspartate) O-methyltransferase
MTDTRTPTAEAHTAARQRLVDALRDGGHIQSPAVEEAFRQVPRHVFVPTASLEDAYADKVVSIKDDEDGRSLSCASQPRVVAMMLEQAQIEPGMRVLELGTGTGYNAALIAHLVGPQGRVVTIDVDQDLTDNATAHLTAAGAGNVEVVLGDGALGHEAGAPYDRIIATVGSHRIPAAWVLQLAPHGRLIAPVRIAGDVSRSIAVEFEGGKWVSVDSQLSTFMPLRDSVGDDTRAYVPVTADGRVTVQANQEQTITPEQVTGVLDEPATSVWTGVAIGGMEPRDGLWLRLAVKLDNSLSRMNASRAAIDSGLVSPGLPWGDMASVAANGRGLAYLTSRRVPDEKNLWEFGVIGHGEAGQRLAERMAAEIRAWDRTLDVSFELSLHGQETVLRPMWS